MQTFLLQDNKVWSFKTQRTIIKNTRNIKRYILNKLVIYLIYVMM